MVPSYRPHQSQGLRNGSLSQLVPGSGEGQHRTVEPSVREALGQGACVHSNSILDILGRWMLGEEEDGACYRRQQALMEERVL